MFRDMRRFRQKLSEEESIAMLERGSWGVLSVLGDEGYPYGVPLCYAYSDGKIYFHCARSGHKNDALKNEPKASFCVVDSDEIVPEEYTSHFRSVIVFGKVHEVEDDKIRRDVIERIAVKFHPHDTAEHRNMAIDKQFRPMCILEMDIEHISGKEAIELVKKREANV